MTQFEMPSHNLRGRGQYSILSIFISILPFVSISHTQRIASRQTAGCTDPAAIPSPSCWEALQIPAWLAQFAGPDSSCARSKLTGITGADTSWGACFTLTVNHGDEGQTVAQQLGQLNAYPTAESLDQDALQMLPVEDRPRYLYVLRALSHLGQFFDDWNKDMSSYVIASEFDVPAILGTLDMEQHTSFAADDLYRALLLGLPFSIAYNGTYFPAFNAIGIPPELSLNDFGGLLLELVDLASVPLSNSSAPANVTGVVEASTLSSKLVQFAPNLSSRVQYGLQSVTNDLDTFHNATANGAFASAQQWTIPQGPAILLQPLDTFLVSSILAQNNWTVLALVGIDVAALSHTSTGTLPAWVLKNCPTCTPPVNFGCTSYDARSQCGRWWYSQDLNSSFTLVQTGNVSNDPTNLISTVFQQGWTTGELLFENAAICDEPPGLVERLASMEMMERPASPLTDFMDSWFWRLMGVASHDGTNSVDIVVSDAFNAYIESRPGPVSHPSNTLFNVSGSKIDFACMSQLDLQVGWDWRRIAAGDFS